jgi:hypothetical protein
MKITDWSYNGQINLGWDGLNYKQIADYISHKSRMQKKERKKERKKEVG